MSAEPMDTPLPSVPPLSVDAKSLVGLGVLSDERFATVVASFAEIGRAIAALNTLDLGDLHPAVVYLPPRRGEAGR